MAPAYKLSYFNLPALAEPIRWMFAYAGIEFEDDRFEPTAWPELKPKMPFGQVPVLTHNGKEYNQSIAIARFAAKQAKLVGKDDFEDMEIDGIIDTITDLKTKLRQVAHEPDETKKETLKVTLFSETFPFYLTRLDKIAKDNGGYLACKKLTWADFVFVALFNFIQANYKGTDFLASYENLKKVQNNIMAIPQVKKWIEEHP